MGILNKKILFAWSVQRAGEERAGHILGLLTLADAFSWA